MCRITYQRYGTLCDPIIKKDLFVQTQTTAPIDPASATDRQGEFDISNSNENTTSTPGKQAQRIYISNDYSDRDTSEFADMEILGIALDYSSKQSDDPIKRTERKVVLLW